MASESIEIKRTGAQINILGQDDETVHIQVYMKDSENEWYTFKTKVPKGKIKKM